MNGAGRPDAARGGSEAQRIDRFTLSAGAVGWVYGYRSALGVTTSDWISSGLEISVQLAGTWRHEGRWGGAHTAAPGEAIYLSPGETYSHAYGAAAGATGLQVGLLLLSEEHPLLADANGELRWGARAPHREPRLVELARYVLESRVDGRVPDRATVESALLEAVSRHGELVARDGVLAAKREMDRTLSAQLYMRHFAGLADMSENTFARRFAERFGVPPVRYRQQARINAAARILAAGSELSCAEIASQVGFEDESFFYRTFKAQVGLTPHRYAARFVTAPAPPF